jgi:DNA-binding transcriptional ArsR family regulator
MLVNQNVKYISPIERLSVIFAALGDPVRLAILERLSQSEATVNELAEPFTITLPAISRHLKVLERAGLITRKPKAQWRRCSLETDSFMEIAAWADKYKKLWGESFDGLEAYLATVQNNHKDGNRNV